LAVDVYELHKDTLVYFRCLAVDCGDEMHVHVSGPGLNRPVLLIVK